MYLLEEPVGEVAKDNGVPRLLVLIRNPDVGQLPEVGPPTVQPPVGGAKVKQDNLLVREGRIWTDGSIKMYIR